MTFKQLALKIKTPMFRTDQVQRFFPNESPEVSSTQLSRFTRQGQLIRLKRGFYLFSQRRNEVSEFTLAGLLYQPSYISLETALNYYGLIPDVPQHVTSITTITSKTIKTPIGTYFYSKIAKKLYFGFQVQFDPSSPYSYRLASPEKAILDWIYLRQLKSLAETRLDMAKLDPAKLKQLAQVYPNWVRKVVL